MAGESEPGNHNSRGIERRLNVTASSGFRLPDPQDFLTTTTTGQLHGYRESESWDEAQEMREMNNGFKFMRTIVEAVLVTNYIVSPDNAVTYDTYKDLLDDFPTNNEGSDTKATRGAFARFIDLQNQYPQEFGYLYQAQMLEALHDFYTRGRIDRRYSSWVKDLVENQASAENWTRISCERRRAQSFLLGKLVEQGIEPRILK